MLSFMAIRFQTERLALTTTHFVKTLQTLFFKLKNWFLCQTLIILGILDHLSVMELARDHACQFLRRCE